MTTSTTVIYYQRLVRLLKRAGRMVSSQGDESEFQQACEFELRRAGIPFVAQSQAPSGDRPDLIVGGWVIELKVDRSKTMPGFSVGGQVLRYLEAFPTAAAVIIAVLHIPSQQVHIHQTTRDGGAPLVLRRNGIQPRKAPRSRGDVTSPIEMGQEGGEVEEVSVSPHALSQDDYVAIKGFLKRYRDLLLCKVLRATGLRLAEVLRLTGAHFVREGPGGSLLVRRGKQRGRPAWEHLPIGAELALEVDTFIRGNGIQPSQPIFGITPRQAQRIFAAAGLEAIGRPVHPHEFRGLYITWLIDNGYPVETASKMVGHQSTRTTLRWYYKLTDERRREIQLRVPV